MNLTWQEGLIILALVIGSYLIGNINFAVIISKFKQRDVRKEGSGNPGTMNMIRNFGKAIGALTLVVEIIKGALPALIGWLIIGGIGFGGTRLVGGVFIEAPPRIGIYIAGLSVMLGHVFPVFFKFKGGKGIATAIGVGLIAQPIIAPLAFGFGMLFIHLTKIGALGSFTIISIPLAVEGFFLGRHMNSTYIGYEAWAVGLASIILIFCMFSFTLFTHRKNIVNLFTGKEHRTLIWGKEAKAAKAEKKRLQQLEQEKQMQNQQHQEVEGV